MGNRVMGFVMMAAALVPGAARAQPAPAQAPAAQVRRLTADEAVRLALENNLGLQVARLDPQIQDLNVAAAGSVWKPTFTSTLLGGRSDSPNSSFLSGAQGAGITNGRVLTNVGVEQPLKWGGRYSVGWDTTRSTTTNIFSNFSPQIQSSLAFSYQQPLLRGFGIDSQREQLLVSEKNREIADVTVRQSAIATTRAVRNAYADLVYALASLDVAQQSLDLARESLRNTRSRVEIGTTPPIDVVEAESEEATREEAVIVAQAQIETAGDTLRALVYNPETPDFWNIRIEPSGAPEFQPRVVDVDAAVRSALQRRTDLLQARKTLEQNDIAIRFLRNETLPDVTANVDYGLTGLGGTQVIRGAGFPGDIIGQTQRNFGAVLRDLFGNNFPSWTATVNISYPIGATAQEANLARARLEYSQSMTDIRNRELQVVTEVRNAARQVTTNQRRVQTTGVARQLAERRLEAEQRKLAAGTSTTFLVFQAQRDLAVARNNELLATLDANKSSVDLDTVQEAPLTAAR